MNKLTTGFGALIALMALLGGFVAPTVAAAAEDTVLYSGSFKGRSGHATSGEVRIVERDGRTLVILQQDFRFDGAPDPKLGFSRDRRQPKRLFSPLSSNRGEQVYELPAGVDTSNLQGLNLWCERFGVQLGYAKF
ncbi:MAG: DM13 domain-containing protein [Pseudomonadota bacterium]